MKRYHVLVIGFTFVSANFSVMLINYGFHIVTAHQLSATSYGLMSALMAVFAVVAYVSIGLQTKCADLVAKSPSSQSFSLGHPVVSHWFRNSVLASISVAGLIIVFSSTMATQLHAKQYHIILLGIAIATILPLSCLRGFLLGKELYFGLSLNMVAESATKFVAAYIVLKSGYGLAAVILTIIGGQLVGLLLALTAIQYPRQDTTTADLDPPNLPVWLMSVYFACFAIWSTLDVIVVQMFHPDVAGAYSVGTRIGQVVLFCLTTMTTFLYPKFSKHSTDRLSYNRLFLPALLSLLIIGSILGLVLFELRSFVVLTVFGSQYELATSWIGYLCLSALALGLSHLTMHFMLANANRHIIVAYLLFTGLFVIGVVVSAMQSVQHLLWVMVAANWLLFMSTLIFTRLARKASLTAG